MAERKFTTIAVSKDMVKLIDELVRNSGGLYRTKAEFINSALREKIERVRAQGHVKASHVSHHDPAIK